MATTHLGITEISQSQSQKEATANAAFEALDQAINGSVDLVITGATTISANDWTGNFEFNLSGTPGAFTLNTPATNRFALIVNGTDGDATVQVTGGGGDSVVIFAGNSSLIFCDGVNIASVGGGDSGGGGGDSVLDITITGDGTLSDAEISSNGIFNLSGTPGATFELNVPASAQRSFIVENGSDSTATVQVTGGAGANVAVAASSIAQVFTDGTDVKVVPGDLEQTALNIRTITGTSDTLVLLDAGKYLRTTNGSAVAVTVPAEATVDYNVGTQIVLTQAGSGQITVVQDTGVTINTPETLLLRQQFSSATLTKVGADEWDLIGDLQSA